MGFTILRGSIYANPRRLFLVAILKRPSNLFVVRTKYVTHQINKKCALLTARTLGPSQEPRGTFIGLSPTPQEVFLASAWKAATKGSLNQRLLAMGTYDSRTTNNKLKTINNQQPTTNHKDIYNNQQQTINNQQTTIVVGAFPTRNLPSAPSISKAQSSKPVSMLPNLGFIRTRGIN